MHWFGVLQKMFPPIAGKVLGPGPILGRIPIHVIAPLFLNQMVAVPTLYYPFFFGWTGAIRGSTLGESMEKMKDSMPRVLFQNWSIWLPAQAVQFAMVPPSYHILYVSAVGLVWSSVLSYTTSGSIAQPAVAGAEEGCDAEAEKGPSVRAPAAAASAAASPAALAVAVQA